MEPLPPGVDMKNLEQHHLTCDQTPCHLKPRPVRSIPTPSELVLEGAAIAQETYQKEKCRVVFEMALKSLRHKELPDEEFKILEAELRKKYDIEKIGKSSSAESGLKKKFEILVTKSSRERRERRQREEARERDLIMEREKERSEKKERKWKEREVERKKRENERKRTRSQDREKKGPAPKKKEQAPAYTQIHRPAPSHSISTPPISKNPEIPEKKANILEAEPVTKSSIFHSLAPLSQYLGKELAKKIREMEKTGKMADEEQFLEQIEDRLKRALWLGEIQIMAVRDVKKILEQIEEVKKKEVRKEGVEMTEREIMKDLIIQGLRDEGRTDATPLELEQLTTIYLDMRSEATKSEPEPEMTDGDLEILLSNFSILDEDEQDRLIHFLRQMEVNEPQRVHQLKKFVNFSRKK